MRGRWMPVLLPVALVAGCGTAAPARPADGDLMMAAGVSRVTPAAGTDVGPLVAGMTAFGHDLLGAMGEDAEGNVVISPLSIAYAFGMAEAGDPEAHQPPTVAIANGLFVQKDYPLKQAFLQILAAQYGTGARTVDFAQAPQ